MNSYFRGIRVELECGHETVVATSFYRLVKARVSVILGSVESKGVWCFKCKHGGQALPVKYLGTCRLNELEPSPG